MVYEALKARLLTLIEQKAPFKELLCLMHDAVKHYSELIDPDVKPKPLVAVNGEIFVRLHSDANHETIRMLEQYGLEVKISPLTQWMEYINKNAVRLFKKSGNWKKYFLSRLKKSYMERTGEKLSGPFTTFLGKRQVHDSGHIIDAAHNNLIYNRMIRGESALTIGETYLFSQNQLPEISGICHIWPFGCMHETAATSQIHSFTGRQKETAKTLNEKVIPFIDAVFGDSELPNLEAEIAVFAEKCYLKQQLQNREKELKN
jgi:predicted nucleotide-binding protein (sugar kinase/HSP70/actin superfamily)